MKRTQESLGDLVNYEAVTGIRPLEPPKIEKGYIPNFVRCSNFNKAQSRIERTMERYNRKMEQLEERVQQSNGEIASFESDLQHWEDEVGKGVGWLDRMFVDRSDPGSVEKYNEAVARHNDAIEQVRHYKERISDAMEKHDELVDRYNEAVEEARDQLATLDEEALSEIDGDIVTFLDRCTQIATKLSDSENSGDLVAALEICFIALKIYRTVEEHIDTNVARQEARGKLGEIHKLFLALCGNEDIRSSIVDLFRRNAYIVEQNVDLYSQMVQVVGSVDQNELNSMTQSLEQVFDKKVKTQFDYVGIIDPAKLDIVVDEMNQSINAIDANIAKARELFESTRQTAEAAVSAHQNGETLLATMKTNVEEIHDDLFHKGHFACDMVEEGVISDFYDREFQPAATAMRGHLVERFGEEQLDALIMGGEDRYSLEKAEAAIKQANLLRLQAQREQVDGYVKKCSGMIQELRRHIHEAEQVPRQNSDAFRLSASRLYLLSYFPLVGFIAALAISNKIEAFAAAFSSTNQVYRELGTEILAKNRTAQMTNTVLIFNIVAALVLRQAGKRLRSYMGT